MENNFSSDFFSFKSNNFGITFMFLEFFIKVTTSAKAVSELSNKINFALTSELNNSFKNSEAIHPPAPVTKIVFPL